MPRLPSVLIAGLAVVTVTGCTGHASPSSRPTVPPPTASPPSPTRVTLGVETRIDTAVDDLLRKMSAQPAKPSLDTFVALKEACAAANAAITAALTDTKAMTPVRPEYDDAFVQDMTALFDAVNACPASGDTTTIDRSRTELLAALRLLYG